MDTQQAYNVWASQYDTNHNKTRDLEAIAIREVLSQVTFTRCLEIGCGTGKNTQWLITKASDITSVDLSEQMLAKAKEKIRNSKVQFVQADILEPWSFASAKYDLVTFSLVLEHIENVEAVFEKVSAVLNPGGYVYVGELHPFKQYAGTKARFDTNEGTQVVPCFNHHVSDFVEAAHQHKLSTVLLKEYFDENDRATLPRVLALLLQNKN